VGEMNQGRADEKKAKINNGKRKKQQEKLYL